MSEIIIIIPAYKEEAVIECVVDEVSAVMDQYGRAYEILVVDDGSQDQTAAKAQHAGVGVIIHPYNIGNGAAVKTGIRNLGAISW